MLLDIPEKELKGLHIISPNGVIRPFVPANFVPKEPKFGFAADRRMSNIVEVLNNRIDNETIHHIVDVNFISDSNQNRDHYVCLYRYY